MRRFDRAVWFGAVSACWIVSLIVLAMRPDLIEATGLSWGRRAQARHLFAAFALGAVTVVFFRRLEPTHFGPIRSAVSSVLLTGSTTVALVLARNISDQDLSSAGTTFEAAGAVLGMSIGLAATYIIPLDVRSRLRGIAPPTGLFVSALILGWAIISGGSGSVAETSDCEPGRPVQPARSNFVQQLGGAEIAANFDSRGDASVDEDGTLMLDGGSFRSVEHGRVLEDAASKSGQVTISTWIRPADLEQAGPARILTMSGGIGSGQMNLHLGQDADRMSFRIRTSCALFNWVASPAVLDGVGTEHHVVASYAGGIATIHVDGEQVATQDLGNGDLLNWDPDVPLVVGNEVTDNRPYQGEIRHLLIFDRALRDDEIAELYAAGW